MTKVISKTKALDRLARVGAELRAEISGYESKARDCSACETKGACCLDAHFVNVRISRLEAVAINRAIAPMGTSVQERVDTAVVRYGLDDESSEQFACPLFEKSVGCLVHTSGKPLPCIAHACYENKADLPPDELLTRRELAVDRLNAATYGRAQPWLPLPLALQRYR